MILQTKIDNSSKEYLKKNDCILELRVNNHPGVMSHICGLFARRAFNVEKIICLPIGNGEESKIYLMINTNERLDQITKQLIKLEDVMDVCQNNFKNDVFIDVENLLTEELA
jgi:acetolactate synthase-1/3 small subunit